MNDVPEENRRPAAARSRDRHILRAGTALFAELGCDSTPMSLVAERAGVAVGTIYLRYPNKRSLLAGVMKALEEELAGALLSAAKEELPWEERFIHIFRAMIEAVSSSHEMGAIMRLASHADLDHYEGGSTIRGAIERIVARARESGAFRLSVSPKVVAALAYGMVEGAMNHMMSSDREPPESYISALAEASSRWLIKEPVN